MRRAFTLIELIIVILIICVLVGMVLPYLAKSRAVARLVACESNLTQGSILFRQHVEEYKGLPINNYWTGKPFKCPSDKTNLPSYEYMAPYYKFLVTQEYTVTQQGVRFFRGDWYAIRQYNLDEKLLVEEEINWNHLNGTMKQFSQFDSVIGQKRKR